MRPIFKLLLCCSFIFIQITNELKAQMSTDSVLIDTNLYEETSYFSAGLSYTTNNVGSKVKSDSTIGATIADISFYHKSGFYTSVMPTFYDRTGAKTYDLDLSLGYSKFFNSGIDVTAYYQYHIPNKDSLFSGIEYNNLFHISLGYYIDNFYLYSDAYALVGKTNNYFVEPGISYYLNFDKLLFKKDNLSFFPMISASFGTDYWVYEDFSLREYKWISYKMSNQGYQIDNFGFHNLDIMLPITYSYSNLSFTFTYLYTSPSNKFKALGWENKSGFMFSLSYILNL